MDTTYSNVKLNTMYEKFGQFIDGKWQQSSDKKTYEVRMGKGKGSNEYWACRVKPGRIMFEVDGVDIEDARKAMMLAAAKLPIKCKFVERNI